MANQIYCKHCGKQIDADSTFCMHCGGVINPNSNSTHQANMQNISFIHQLDILGGKFLIGIINIIKWCGRTLINFGKFIKQYWKRILIFIIGIACALLLIVVGFNVYYYRIIFMLLAILLIILTLYFSCSKSIKLLLPSGILLFCSYGALIYLDYENIYGINTTFFDTIKREFCLVTPNYIIPDHATSIGNGAFCGCDGLTSVTIPDSVTEIGSWAFNSCTSLTSVHISDLSAWCKIDFSNGYANPLREGAELYINGTNTTNITIPSDITKINKYTFYGCTSLTSITIPDSVTKIGEDAFGQCDGLTSIRIPDSVTSIGNGAFGQCDGLTSITIPDSVTSIGNGAFWGCDGLTSVTIPDSVTDIGQSAFFGCTSLTSIYCKPTTPPTGNDDMFMFRFWTYSSDRKIYVPRNSVDAYKSAEYWKEYADYIVGYDF